MKVVKIDLEEEKTLPKKRVVKKKKKVSKKGSNDPIRNTSNEDIQKKRSFFIQNR